MIANVNATIFGVSAQRGYVYTVIGGGGAALDEYNAHVPSSVSLSYSLSIGSLAVGIYTRAGSGGSASPAGVLLTESQLVAPGTPTTIGGITSDARGNVFFSDGTNSVRVAAAETGTVQLLPNDGRR